MAFLARHEARDSFVAWHESGHLPLGLNEISTCAQLNLPQYAHLASSGSVSAWTQYRLAAMLCTQVKRGPSPSQRIDIDCLRAYLLLKAFESAKARLEPSAHIAEASKHLINFLEDSPRYPDGIKWICELSSANQHFPTYEVNIVEAAKGLKAHLIENKGSINNWSAGQKFADALQAVAEGRAEKHSPLAAFSRPNQSSSWGEEWRSTLVDLDLPEPPEEILTLPPVQLDEEDDEPTALVVFNTPPTAEHRFRVGLGLHLETQAQRNRVRYAWDRLRPDEIERLFATIDQWLKSPSEQLLGAISALALATGRSIEVVCSTQIAAAPIDSNWVLDLERRRLVRPPSRPVKRAVAPEPAPTPGGSVHRWVKPLAELQELQLSDRLLAPLLSARQQRSSAGVLGELWTEVNSPQATFDRYCAQTPGLERIRQGMLKTTADQLLFDWTQDSAFCRMLLTTDLALRPSACSYAAWTLTQANARIQKLSGQTLMPPSDVPEGINGLGSEIDPDDQRIRESLTAASLRLEELLSSSTGAKVLDWHEIHNAITIYCVVLLLAYTGARPTRSVFEVLGDFDLEKNRLFLDDKVVQESKPGRWGRIVPLPNEAATLMTQLYLPYLEWLMERLAAHASENSDFDSLSQAISSQLQRRSKPVVPLFFLITRSPDLRIMEVSESAIEVSTLFDWPLPANVFRHRMATQLRRLPGGDDLAAAQLGHAESGTDVYGAISTRCWVDDEPGWRTALATTLRPIAVAPIRFQIPACDVPNEKSSFGRFLSAGSFGSKARSAARTETRKLASAQALKRIHERVALWLNESPDSELHLSPRAFPDRLSDEQIAFLAAADRWTELGRDMLYIDGRTPRPNHAIWFDVYEEFRSNACRDTYSALSDRIVVKRKQGFRFAFSHDALHAESRVQALREGLNEAFVATPSYARALADHSLLAALDMALSSMVSNLSLLKLIEPKLKDSLRLHSRDSVVYMARDRRRDERDAPPFAWHCVPARSVASFLALSESQGKELSSTQIPRALRAFASKVELTLGLAVGSVKERHQLIKMVADLVHDHNQLHLPGIVAAARRGELATWSLNAYSQGRALFGLYAYDLREALQATSTPTPLVVPIEIPRLLPVRGERKAEEALLKEVRSALRNFENAAKGKNWSDRQRKVAATLIERRLSSATRQSTEAGVGTTIQLLVAWILNMLREPGASGKELRASSVRTYLSLLASGFLDYGRDVDLLEADEEEIEHFYSRVLSRPVDEAQRRSAHDGQGRRLDEHAVLGRLRDFHAFLERRYGVESPDWSALGEDLTSSQVSAEIITPSEYEAAIRALCVPGSLFNRDAYLEGFLLILGYRFGLRSGEGISLARRDWVVVHHGCVVLVSGTHRTPKSKAGRRQVPLLGSLTEHERAVVEGWMTYWDALHLASSDAPLFPSLTNEKVPARVNEHRLRVIQALRSATGSDRVTFHHARHSFATLLSIRLLSPSLISELKGLSGKSFWEPTDVQSQLLGTTAPTRRSAWALAVALGHAHPETTLVSYCHHIHDWANALAIKNRRAMFAADGSAPDALQVVDIKLATGRYGAPKSFPIARRPRKIAITAADVMHFLERLSHGLRPSLAAWLSELDAVQTRYLMDPLSRFDETQAGGFVDVPVSNQSILGQMISSLSASRWSELRDLLAKVALPPAGGPAALWQLSGARQILLWSREHFDRVREVISAMGWTQADFEMFSPPFQTPHSDNLAKLYGWTLASPQSAAGSKRIQVDMARHPLGEPGHTAEVKDRVGLVVAPFHPDLRDRKELILVWLAIHLRTVS
ncbi:tyrosine-type recombinase/integrase [Hydrogenophaga sp. XSHU_21]